jgi:Cu(I)/Ag(I) efflux system protein CusF
MKSLRQIIYAAMLAATALTSPAFAQGSADLTEGEVRKIDKENGKITLKHGDIRNLDMPGMTMVFQVPNRSLLDRVKVGDKVRFRAANEGSRLTVTDIQPVK